MTEPVSPSTFHDAAEPPNPRDSDPATSRSIDDLDAALCRLARRMNADNYTFLLLLREFDERFGWQQWGSINCASWLAWRCDMSLSAARERVRVAHALKPLPVVSSAFESGDLSYSKARAITRIATPDDEASLVAMARSMTAAHVEQHCQQRHNGRIESQVDANKAHARRSLRSWRDERRGTITVILDLPMADGLLFECAVDKACADQGGSHLAPDDSTSWHALQGDAVVAMARWYLAGGDRRSEPADPIDSASFKTDKKHDDALPAAATGFEATAATSISTADNYLVTIHVDQRALSSNDGQSELPIEIARRLCCDGSVVPIVEGANGEPLNVGRKQRVIPIGIRRALWARDRGCTFPGCSHTRFVDAHHIRHWADGGETSLENLILICSTHHKLLHEGGYSIHRDHRKKRFFVRPDGRAVPESGYHYFDWRDDYSGDDRSDVEEISRFQDAHGKTTGQPESAGT